MMRVNAAGQRARDTRMVVTPCGMRSRAAIMADPDVRRPKRIRETANLTPLNNVIKDGAWTGQRCFVVGGGPSLRGFDWTRLRGELVIGINRAFEVLDPALLYSMDTRFYCWATGNALPASDTLTSEQLTERFRSTLATKVWLRGPNDNQLGPEVYGVLRDKDVDSNPSILHGFAPSSNSGYGALCLALALGASEIYLLGYDMGATAGHKKQEWFHSGYRSVQENDVYGGMLRDFQKHARAFQERARIVNLNPASNLKCFEFGRIEDVTPAPARPLVVGFYTRGTGYEAEAAEMVRSAHRMGLETDVRAIEPRGSWVANCAAKCEVVRHMMIAHPDRALLYVDSDARFQRYPALFDGCNVGDFACHHLRGVELLSGTLYFAPTQAARNLVTQWCAETEVRPDAWDQWTLDAALKRAPCDARLLPVPYCKIFDSRHQAGEEAIIEHFQASRRLKTEVNR